MHRESQIDIIDMQRRPDNTYKFILIYQDFTTQCCILRPLSSICPIKVALMLTTDIFKTFGVPSTLKCTSETFAKKVRDKLLELGRKINVVQTHINEHTDYNIEVLQRVNCWLADKDTKYEWSGELDLIQFEKNLNTYYKVIHLPSYIESVHHFYEKNPNGHDVNCCSSIQETIYSDKRQALNLANEKDLSPTIGNHEKKKVKDNENNALKFKMLEELLDELSQQNPTFSPTEIDEIELPLKYYFDEAERQCL